VRKIFKFLATFVLISWTAGSVAFAAQVQATRTDEPIRIDGVLGEDIWQTAIVAPPLIQDEPNEGAEPSQSSEIRILYDERALYVGARLYDSSPDSIVARLGRRDSDWNTDLFLIGLSPFNDKRTAYFFGLSAAGAIFDGRFYNDDWQDNTWDGVWEGAVQRDRHGWTAEMRIPFSQLRFKKSDDYTWGVALYRKIQRRKEEDLSFITPRNESGMVSRFIDLVGIKDIDARRKAEIMPYLRGKGEYLDVEPQDPFNDGSRYFADAGADLKIGVGNNLTIDGTINPDFGQVEVDPAVINLSDVETYFDEKRPFFIEGSDIFNFGYGGSNNYWNMNFSTPNLFYSRRIGRAPQRDLSEYDYTDVPEGARIISAGKLTGKIGDNWNIGLLNALTAREFARVSPNDLDSQTEAEPLTNYTVLRTQKEFQGGRHGLGIISTATRRFFKDEDIADYLGSNSLVVGVDGWTFLDTAKTWVIAGWGGLSNIEGNQTYMSAIQKNSIHYLQRPDVDHLGVDSTATSLTGFATRLNLNKQKGNVIFNAAFGLIDPKFDVNDLGYLSRGDIVNYHIGAGYRWTKPTNYYRTLQFILAHTMGADCGGNLTNNGIMTFGYVQFPNYYWIDYGGGYFFETYDSRLTRGGPLAIAPTGVWGQLEMSTDERKPLVFELYYEASGNDSASISHYLETGINWKIADNLIFEFSPSISINENYAQYVDVFDDPYADLTYDKRYVFAKMYQKTVSASLRLDWTFTPRLTLQLYAQPLYAAGDFKQFKELARPKSYRFNVYGESGSTISSDLKVDPDGSGPASEFSIDNPNFNTYSFRSSTVLRWEFSPGSALYLVWTHNRYENDDHADFDLSRSVSRIRKIEPDNIFMVKATYWFNI
jgi:hypothetical protein